MDTNGCANRRGGEDDPLDRREHPRLLFPACPKIKYGTRPVEDRGQQQEFHSGRKDQEERVDDGDAGKTQVARALARARFIGLATPGEQKTVRGDQEERYE